MIIIRVRDICIVWFFIVKYISVQNKSIARGYDIKSKIMNVYIFAYSIGFVVNHFFSIFMPFDEFYILTSSSQLEEKLYKFFDIPNYEDKN